MFSGASHKKEYMAQRSTTVSIPASGSGPGEVISGPARSKVIRDCRMLKPNSGEFMSRLGRKIPTGGTQTGLPMTYMHNGRQFIVFTAAAGDATGSAQGVAYALSAGGGGGQREPRGPQQ